MNKEKIAIELTKIYIENLNKNHINKIEILEYYNYFLNEIIEKKEIEKIKEDK